MEMKQAIHHSPGALGVISAAVVKSPARYTMRGKQLKIEEL
jgi:hypothetical protein